MTSARSCVLEDVRRALVLWLCVSCLACGRAAVSPSQGSESPSAATEESTELESETARGTERAEAVSETSETSATGSATESGAVSETPCRVRSLFVEYDRENEPPAAPVRSEVVVERFVDDWSEREVCDRDFEDYAARPMRCAPRARSRAVVRGDVLAPDRVRVGMRDGESLLVIFDERGRTRRIEWDPTASGSFDYAFEYEYDCAR
jgi:hypothetical protein